jgi:hypothetical protein
MPPGAEKLTSLISASDLTATEVWKPDFQSTVGNPGRVAQADPVISTKAKVGDAFTRTLTFTATDVPGMAFPPFRAGRVEGLAVYPKPPQVQDQGERGVLQGKRIEAVTYICQRPGIFTIPAASLTWWNTESAQLQIINFPAHKLEVIPNPAMAQNAQGAGGVPAANGKRWIIMEVLPYALGFVALLVICVAFRTRYRDAVTARLSRARNAFVTAWRDLISFWSPVHLAPLNPPQKSRDR